MSGLIRRQLHQVMNDGYFDNEVVKTFPSRKMDHPITLR
jgi:hypothetical protein